VQFGCGRGVHLPFHLLQLSQHLISDRSPIVRRLKPTIEYEHGLLDGAGMEKFKYVYFTEADQITMMRYGAIPSIVNMLNRTNYVAPQRMQMLNSEFMKSHNFDQLSIAELTKRKFKELNDTMTDEYEEVGRKRRRRRRRRLSDISTNTDSTHVSHEPFNLENECGVGIGEVGYLGKPSVHLPFGQHNRV
jgi:hypothetical protein